jgi:dCMP deaminase
MDMASTASERSHDSETKVGAVLVHNDNGAVIATGFNGFVRQADDSELPTTRPGKYEFIVHSEENLIYNCARLGISMNNCTLVCTLSPCRKCMRALWQCGITTVIAKEKYRDFDEVLAMKDIGITEETMEEGFVRLTYVPKT